MLAEVVRAIDVRAGDEVQVGKLGMHVVSAVHVYDDVDVVVCYFRHGEETYENKARLRGRGSHGRLVEQSLAKRAPDDPVVVVRGRGERADELRARMERQQSERFAGMEARHA
jgi:hypothetical protein